jgi:hypothetical protein
MAAWVASKIRLCSSAMTSATTAWVNRRSSRILPAIRAVASRDYAPRVLLELGEAIEHISVHSHRPAPTSIPS